MEAPIAVLGTKVDQSADEMRAVRENLADLTRRLAALDNKLADISSAVRTLNTPATAPPPPPRPQCDCAGVDGTGCARRCYGGNPVEEGRPRLHRPRKTSKPSASSLTSSSIFADDDNAPEGQYYMGLIYDHGEQYDDAAQVFQAVVERYPDSPKAADAMYMKGVEYQKARQRQASHRRLSRFHQAVSQARQRAQSAGPLARSDRHRLPAKSTKKRK